MFINKNGLNKITAGRVAGDEIKTALVIGWNDLIFIVANVAGLLWLAVVLAAVDNFF